MRLASLLSRDRVREEGREREKREERETGGKREDTEAISNKRERKRSEWETEKDNQNEVIDSENRNRDEGWTDEEMKDSILCTSLSHSLSAVAHANTALREALVQAAQLQDLLRKSTAQPA